MGTEKPDVTSNLMIEPTSFCNVKCSFCNLSTINKGFMPLEYFKSIPLPIEVERVFLWWRGEPLMHPDIVEMVKYITGKGIEACITTNGLLLTKDISSRLKEANLTLLDISLCGATKEVYEATMIGSNFDVLMKNIEDARPLDPKIRVTITKENVHQIPLFEKLIKDLGLEGSIMKAVDTEEPLDVPSDFIDLTVAEIMRNLKVIAWDGTNSTLFDKDCTGVVRESFGTKIKFINKEA